MCVSYLNLVFFLSLQIWAEIFKFTKEIPEIKQVEELMDPPLSSVSPHQEYLPPVESVYINRYKECW